MAHAPTRGAALPESAWMLRFRRSEVTPVAPIRARPGGGPVLQRMAGPGDL